MDDVPIDGGLRNLLSDAIDEAEAVVTSLRGVAPPAGDEGHVWRWALMYLVLAYDLGGSALTLSDGSHNRALLILRRALFEYVTRLRYYRMHPEIARAHLEDFERLAKLFQRRIDDDAFQLILDPAFPTPQRMIGRSGTLRRSSRTCTPDMLTTSTRGSTPIRAPWYTVTR
jgi:hypothetical protein